jgi:hypothetical protein
MKNLEYMPTPKVKRVNRKWYAKLPGTDWMGPWDTANDAIEYSHRIFCVDCPFCSEAN